MLANTLLTAALISAVSAHQNWQQLWINDVSPGQYKGIRMPTSNSPVTDITSKDMACNVLPADAPVVEATAANEGDTIKVKWDSSSHPGPITHYLYGPVADATKETGAGAGWFKIDELDAVDGKWANEIMMANDMTHTFKLPTGLASGDYLLRSEMLALHASQTVGGGQFYIGCAPLKISGSGKGACGPTISIPGAYKAEDPSIYIPKFYNGFDISSYKAPGGPVASCGGAASAAPVASAPAAGNSTTPSTTAAPVVSSVVPSVVVETPEASASETPVEQPTVETPPIAEITSAPFGNATSSTFPTAAPSTFATLVKPSAQPATPTGGNSSGGVAQVYQRCGGKNWTGPTTCVSGTNCVKQNDWYSQCLNM